MPKILRRFIKGGGGVAADQIKTWLADLKELDEEQQQEWWWEVTHEFVVSWLETTEELAPRFVQGKVENLELKWFQLRRKELERILQGLREIEVDEMGVHEPDCMRALVTHASTLIGSLSNQTWANEWRFYVDGLERFKVQPHFPVPPSFSGKFPPGIESMLDS